MSDRCGDILRIKEQFGSSYTGEDKAFAAGICEGHHISSFFTGDAEAMFDLLANMAGNVIAMIADSPEQMGLLRLRMSESIRVQSMGFWRREHPDFELAAARMESGQPLQS